MRTVALLMMLAVVLVAQPASAGGGGGCHERVDTAGEPLVVSMNQSCFGPDVLRVGAGDTVRFVNNDPYGHTVTGAGLEWGSVDIMSYEAATEVTFDTPGVYPYMCILHPGMAGAIIVEAEEAAAAAPAAPTSPSVASTSVIPALVIGTAALGILALAWTWTRRPDSTEEQPLEPATS